MLISEIEPTAQSIKLPRTNFYGNISGSRDVIPKNKEVLKQIVDSPCFKACEYLYDCNILTQNSSANKNDVGNKGYITINYYSLNGKNKDIVKQLMKRGIIEEKELDDSYREEAFDISLSINKTTTYETFSEKMLEIALIFEPQEILYGFFTEEEFIDYTLKNCMNSSKWSEETRRNDRFWRSTFSKNSKP